MKTTLSDVVLRTSVKCQPEISSEMRWVGADHVDEGDFKVRRWSTTDDPLFPPTFKFRVPAGSVLLHSRNPKKVATLDFDAITGEKFFCLVSADPQVLDSRFLALQLQSSHFAEYVSRWMSGSVNKFLNWSALANYEFELPSLDEQEQLTTLLFSVDGHLEDLRAEAEAMRELRLAMFRHMFDSAPLRCEKTNLGSVAIWGSGGTPNASRRDYYDGDIPWCVIGDLTGDVVHVTQRTITREGLDNSNAKVVKPGTVLVAMYGSIGRTGMAGIPMATNQAIAFANGLEGRLDNRFLLYFLQSQESRFVSAGRGAVQSNISQKILKEWPMFLPSIEEQLEFCKEIGQLERGALSVTHSIEATSQLRASILNKELS